MKNTLAAKVIEGFHNEGWQALGRGGTWAGAMRPLEAYVNRKIERAVKAEREACADLCDQWNASHPEAIAAAIRARGSKE